MVVKVTFVLMFKEDFKVDQMWKRLYESRNYVVWKLGHFAYTNIYFHLKLGLLIYLSSHCCHLSFRVFIFSFAKQVHLSRSRPVTCGGDVFGFVYFPYLCVVLFVLSLCHWPHSRSPASGRAARGVIARVLALLSLSLPSARVARVSVGHCVCRSCHVVCVLSYVYRYLVFFGWCPLVKYSGTCLNVRALFCILCLSA